MEVVRPFYPGGDYENYNYPENCVVLDNPPFSILAKIVRFYLDKGIKFFLFAPSLTLFGTARFKGVTAVVAHAEITYANGAVVRTSFLTNMEGKNKVIVAGGLCKELSALSAAMAKRGKPSSPVVKKHYPDALISAANLGRLCVRGLEFKIPFEECRFVRRLDNQTESAVFGGGFLISERAAAERAAAERIELSVKERAFIRFLNMAGKIKEWLN